MKQSAGIQPVVAWRCDVVRGRVRGYPLHNMVGHSIDIHSLPEFYSIVNLKLRYLDVVDGFSVTLSFSLPKLIIRSPSWVSV